MQVGDFNQCFLCDLLESAKSLENSIDMSSRILPQRLFGVCMLSSVRGFFGRLLWDSLSSFPNPDAKVLTGMIYGVSYYGASYSRLTNFISCDTHGREWMTLH